MLSVTGHEDWYRVGNAQVGKLGGKKVTLLIPHHQAVA
jgi:hypothetical protein